MVVSLKHTTVAAGTDAGNGEIHKDEWNEEHTLTMSTNFILGRATAGDGPAEEIPCTAFGRSLIAAADGPAGFAVLGNMPIANLNTGTGATAATFWRGDGVWATPAGGGDMVAATYDPGNVAADVYDMENKVEGANNKILTVAERAKLAFVAITQAVDLDAIEARVNELDAAVVTVGAWDASAGTFPGGGTAQAGHLYFVSVAGTVDGVVFSVNDRIIALTDNASTVTYVGNWFKRDYSDEVLSVAGLAGVITAGALRTALNLVVGVDVQAFDADILKRDVAAELTAGFRAQDEDNGTFTTGTFTPNPAGGNMQQLTNGGAHTWAIPAQNCTMVILVRNNASAGAINTTAYDVVDGDTITTTNGHDFFFYITRFVGFSLLTVKALQ